MAGFHEGGDPWEKAPHGTGDPYRGGVSEAPDPPPSHDEMMGEMRCSVEHNRYPKSEWEAKILWLERHGCRAFITITGPSATEAVSKLYTRFKEMLAEGWKRSK